MKNLYLDTINKKYTDIEIILIDPNNTHTINAHKCVLGSNSPYFNTMFGFGREKTLTSIPIQVDNSKIALDVILTFYDKPIDPAQYSNSKYLLDMFKCRSFFCLNNDSSLLYGIDVASEDFDLLISVVEDAILIEDAYMLCTIKKNMPLDYDLSKLTIEFAEALVLNTKLIATGSKIDHDVRLFDASTGKLLRTMPNHCNSIRSVAFSPNNNFIASASFDYTVRVWNTYTGKILQILRAHTKEVRCVTFSPNNTLIASGSNDNTVRLWCAKSGSLITTLKGHLKVVNCVAFSPNNQLIASGSSDTNIRLWNVKEFTLVCTLSGHSDLVRCVAFSSDNLTLVSSSGDKNIKLWCIQTNTCKFTLRGHTASVFSVAFSTNDSMIVSTGRDCSVKLWCVKTGNLLKTICAHSHSGFFVTFSFDNTKIISAGHDNIINTFNAQTGEVLQVLSRTHTRTDTISCMAYTDLKNEYIDSKLKAYIESQKMIIN